MAAIATPIRPTSGLRDIRRDWRRWSVAERCSAVTIMLALIVLPAAIFIVAHSV